MVRLVFSQCTESLTSGSLLSNTTFHETVELSLTLTVLLVPFVVSLVAGEAASVNVNSSAARRIDPDVAPQLSPEYRVNDSVPFSCGAAVRRDGRRVVRQPHLLRAGRRRVLDDEALAVGRVTGPEVVAGVGTAGREHGAEAPRSDLVRRRRRGSRSPTPTAGWSPRRARASSGCRRARCRPSRRSPSRPLPAPATGRR